MVEFFKLFGNPDALRGYIEGFGMVAPVIFVTLQFIQVIISPIPGNVLTLVGAMVFGFWPGLLMSWAAIVAASLLCFAFARAVGPGIVKKLCGEKLFDKFSRFVGSESTLSRTRIGLVAMMLMPFFPDDLLCFVAGFSAIKFREFTVIILLTRPWGLIAAAGIGAGALTMPPWLMVLLAVVFIALGVLATVFADKIEGVSIKLLGGILKKFSKSGEES